MLKMEDEPMNLADRLALVVIFASSAAVMCLIVAAVYDLL
jgi:hypothetical protein